jgi:uncharacterized protein YjiS (DUF1127 family)
MSVFADHVEMPARSLGAVLRDAWLRLATPRPRREPPLAGRLSDHILRDLGLTRADLDGL